MALRELKNTTQNLPHEIESAIESQLQYYKLYSFRILAKSAMGLVTIFIVGLFAQCIMLTFSMAGAFAIGEWLGSQALGFLIMGFLIIVLLICVFLLRKSIIQKPLLGKLSDIYFKED